MKPKSYLTLGLNDAKKALDFLNTLDDHDDVHSVYSNLDVPDNI